MRQGQGTPPWGPQCRCGHKQLVHRGQGHLGECAALQCVTGVSREGWASGSMCAAFVELAA